jgi:hypothetical protein
MAIALPNLFPASDEASIFDAPNSTGSPERRLILAVLERAILDYVGNDQKELEEAEQWLFGDLKEPSFAPFSFSWVCLQLDLDMQVIARSIAAMPKRGTHKIAPWYFAKVKTEKPGLSNVTKGNFPRYH